MQTTGYYPRRRGVLEHLRDGRLTFLDNAFHDVLCQLADPSTGVALTSAWHLARHFPISRKLAQKHLCRLERKGYIRRFRKARSHSLQITLIHLYECTASPHKGMCLDAWKSESYQKLVYMSVSRAVSTAVSREVSTGALVPIENYVSTRELEKKPAANPAAPATPVDVRPPLSEAEQRRRIAKRDERRAREFTAFREAHVGDGPFHDYDGRFWTDVDLRRYHPELFTEKPVQVATEVSRAADPAEQSIARARDIGSVQQVSRETGEALAAAAAVGHGPGTRELTWEEARELSLLKAKLRHLETPKQNTA